jgi:DNA polymerase-3 subunit beta
MEAVFNARELAAAIGAVSSIIPGKSTLEAITGIHIAAGESVTFSANNYDTGIRYTIDAQVVDPGRVLVSGKLFADLVKRLPGPEISLRLDADKQVLIVTCGGAKYRILTMDVDSFPEVEVVNATNSVEMDAAILKNAYYMTAFAVGNRTDRPFFQGIHIALKNGNLSAVATNSYRLARKQIPFETGDGEFIIPPAALGVITKLIDTDRLHLSWNAGRVVVKTDIVYVVSRLIDGRYPDINRVIPQGMTTTVCIDRKQFQQAIERLELVGLQRMEKFTVFTLKLSVSENLLTLSAETKERGQAKEELPAITTGGPLEISFSGSYITDCLEVLTAEKVVLSLKGHNVAATITSEDDDSYIYVVTPLQMS